jgi:diguanylate cyclase (GGDEF)-like protein
MGLLSSFLCPTELDRARTLEASGRMRVARSICAIAMGVALVAVAPWTGFWTLALFALVAVNLLTLEKRLARTDRPEGVAARSMLFVLLVIAVGVVLSGGEDSPVLPWLIIPSAISGTRFRWQVVVAGAVLTGVVMVAASLIAAPEAVADDPSRLIATFALLVSVTAITSALMHGELIQRDRAVLDPLTGLLNRSALDTRVAEIEQQARLAGGSLSLVLCDIDAFKQVNDTFGHDRGDAVLRDVGYELRKSLRTFELVYRIGGEEFLVLMPGASRDEAVQVAERLRRNIALARPGGLSLTLSAGVASAAGGGLRYDELFRSADAALFQAKRDGRDRVVVAVAREAAVSEAAAGLPAAAAQLS